jgi:hypothetical protein
LSDGKGRLSEVADEENLFRRIGRRGDTNMLVFDQGIGTYSIRSAAFGFRKRECSVYLESILQALGFDWTSIVKNPQNLIVRITAVSVRAHGLQVVHSPWPLGFEVDAPYQAAHGDILQADLSNKQAVDAARQLAKQCVVMNPEPPPEDVDAEG